MYSEEEYEYDEESELEEENNEEEENNREKGDDDEDERDNEENIEDKGDNGLNEGNDIEEEDNNEDNNIPEERSEREFQTEDDDDLKQNTDTDEEFDFLFNEKLDITDESNKSDEYIEQNDESEPDFEALFNEEIENDDIFKEEDEEKEEEEKENEEPNFDELFENKFDVDQEESLNNSSENQENLEDSDDHGSKTEEIENFDHLFEDNDWITQKLKEELPEIPELLQNDVQNQLNQSEENFDHLYKDEFYSDLNEDDENLHKNSNPEKESNQEQHIENFDHLYVDNFNLKSNLDSDSNSNSDSVAHQEYDISPNITDKNEFQNTNAPIENSENLGNIKGVEQDKNIVNENLNPVSKANEKNKIENKIDNKTENQSENEYKNLIEKRLREMKEKDTKSEVHLAELDPKSSEKILKKLPQPPHEKKDKDEKKIEKIDNLTQNIENTESNLMEQISENLEKQTKELKNIKEKTEENLEKVVIANHFATEDYKDIYQKAFMYFVDEHWNAQNEIKIESDNNINNSIDKSQKKIEKIENKIKKKFNKALPTPKGMKNIEGIKPDENKTDDYKSGKDKPRENKKDENKHEEIKTEQQIKKDNQIVEGKQIKKSNENKNSPKTTDRNNTQNDNAPAKIEKTKENKNLGNNKGSEQDKNITRGKLRSGTENSTKNNLQAEKMMKRTVKPGNMTKEQIKIKDKTENEYENLIEKRLREMKENDTKTEVLLAEADPKTAERDLKKLPEPPHEKKNKDERKIEKSENKLNMLTQKLDNVENQLLKDISNTLDNQTKELNDINEKTNHNLDLIHNSQKLTNDGLEFDQFHEQLYKYYFDELIKTQNDIETKSNESIDKSIDEKQLNIDKIDEKIKKAFDKALPTPKGVKNPEKVKTKEKVKEKTKTKEKAKEKTKTKEKIKEKTKTKEKVKEKTKTKEKMKEKTKTKEESKERNEIKEKINDRTKLKVNIYSEILSTFKNKEFIEKFNQNYISTILKKMQSSSKESHINPKIKKSPFLDWLDKGYQKDCISSEIGRKKNQKNPRHNNMPIFIEGAPRNLIKTAFNLPDGQNWQNTLDYQIKDYLISNYQRIKNPSNATKIKSNNSYKRKISVSSKTKTGMVGISKPLKISPEFPISVLKNSKTSSSEIYKLFPSEVQSQESLIQNTIPYKFLMDFRVQIKNLSGNLNLAITPNFQFHSDKELHNALKSSWFQRLSTLLRITIQSINRMKVTLSFGGYGRKQYPIWNAMDWLLEIIDEKGKLNEKHIYKTENDGGVTVYEYYKVLHNMVSAISKEYSPVHAKLIMKNLLPKHLDKFLSSIKIKGKFTLEQVLKDILTNWNNGLDADSFKTKYGQTSELWKIFTSRSDLDTAMYFVSIIQKIANISRCSSSEICNKKLKKSVQMFGLSSVLYPTLNKLLELYSTGNNYDFLKGKTPIINIVQSSDSQVPFSLVTLADNLLRILSAPWNLISNPKSDTQKNLLFNKLAEYIHNRGQSVYNTIAMKEVDNLWINSHGKSLFLNDMNQSKAYLGKFGENNLIKTRTAGKFYWLNQYISDFEHDFITAQSTIVKDDPNADFQLKPGYKFIAAGETLEKGNLPKNLEVGRMSKSKLKKSFLDNAIGFINNFLITQELYGYKLKSYRNDKNFGALSWIENGYFPLYIPYTDITRPSKAKRTKEFAMKTDVDHPEKTKYIGKINPFTDTVTQANSLYDLYAHILATIDKNLRFDDFLTQLRIPEKITKWQIPSVLNKNKKDTISWINRIQWIHGIRVNPSKNFAFDYIINTPPNNPYNLKPDPNYQKKTDPFNPNYDPNLISEYNHKFKYNPALKINDSEYKEQRTLSYYYRWFNNLKNFIDIQNYLSEIVENPAKKPDLYTKLAHYLIFQKFAGLDKRKYTNLAQKKNLRE